MVKGPAVQLYGKLEKLDGLRRELERKGYEVIVITKDREEVMAKYDTETMKGHKEIRSLLLGT